MDEVDVCLRQKVLRTRPRIGVLALVARCKASSMLSGSLTMRAPLPADPILVSMSVQSIIWTMQRRIYYGSEIAGTLPNAVSVTKNSGCCRFPQECECLRILKIALAIACHCTLLFLQPSSIAS